MPSAPVSLGDEAVDFAAKAGLHLFPWQQDVLRGSLGLVQGGKWAARSVGLLVPRQNGKGVILQARELFGMFVLGEPLIIHSAHKFDTSQDHFKRIRELIQGNPDLERHIKSVYTANGKESIQLRNGNELKFKARTISGAGRGFSCDLLVLDEAMYLPEQVVASMLPTLVTRPNPQTWYTSSAGTPESEALWRIVKRGRSQAEKMAYWEWGCESGVDPADVANWLYANPSVGYRAPIDELRENFEVMNPDDFAREFLGIWDDQASDTIFPAGKWQSLEDRDASLSGVPMFGIEAPEDRKWAAIGAVGRGSHEGITLDVVQYDRGMSWVAARMKELLDRNPGSLVGIRPSSPAASLIPEFPEDRVIKLSQQQYAQACGDLYDAVLADQVRHLGQKALDVSVAGAKSRPSGDAKVWDARKSGLDISPFAALTVAAWVHKAYAPVDILASVW